MESVDLMDERNFQMAIKYRAEDTGSSSVVVIVVAHHEGVLTSRPES